MIKEFKYYIEKDLVKKETPDVNEAKSLISKAEGRLNFSIKTRKINENTAPYIFEDIYECLREASQSLMSIKGFKPYSHKALISFLKENSELKEYEISSFNRYRILRNKTVYRGEKISKETCREALNFLLKTLPKIKKESYSRICK